MSRINRLSVVVVNRPGRYMRVQLGGTNPLTLAELQVIINPTLPTCGSSASALRPNGASALDDVTSTPIAICEALTPTAWRAI